MIEIRHKDLNCSTKRNATKIINFLKIEDEMFQLKNKKTKIINLKKQKNKNYILAQVLLCILLC